MSRLICVNFVADLIACRLVQLKLCKLNGPRVPERSATIIYNEMTACGRCRLASGKWGRLVGLLYGCTEQHAFGCISNLCGRACYSSFLQTLR